MSVKALSAVFESSRADGSAFTVLLALADWADHNGWCYPSLLQIAKKARVSKSTAKRAIADLLRLNELERVHRGKMPAADDDEAGDFTRAQYRNLYRITLMKPKEQVSPTPPHLSAPQSAPQVSPTPPHLSAPPVGARSAHQPQPQVGPSAFEVGSNTVAHIRNKPSVDPSVLKAGAPPLAPLFEDPEQNLAVITKVVHEALDLLGLSVDLATLTDTVKSRCAALKIAAYPPADLVRRAIDAALWQRQQRRWTVAR